MHLLSSIERDLPNHRVALASLSRDGDPIALLRLSTALSDFWWQRGRPLEGSSWAISALERNPDPTPLRAEALRATSELCLLSEHPAARQLVSESIDLSRRLGLTQLLARCLNNMGALEVIERDLDSAAAHFQESADLRRRSGDGIGLARALGNLAAVEAKRGNLAQARALVEECLGMEASPFDRAIDYSGLGNLALLANDPSAAVRAFAQALTIVVELRAFHYAAMHLVSLAHVAVMRSDGQRACTLVAAASRLEEDVEVIHDADYLVEKSEVLAAVHGLLSGDTFEAAWGEGRTMSLDRAIEYAIASVD